MEDIEYIQEIKRPTYYKYLVFAICFCSFVGLSKYTLLPFWFPNYTTLLAEIILCTVFFIWRPITNDFRYRYNHKNYIFLTFFVAYAIGLLIYSIFSAHGREETLFIINSSPGIALAFVAYSISPSTLYEYYDFRLIKFLTILFFLFLPFWRMPEGIGYLWGIFLLPLLFYQDLERKRKWILLISAVIIFVIGFTTFARFHCIKIGSILFISFFFYHFRATFLHFYKWIGITILAAPFFFIYAAFFLDFNVFNIPPPKITDNPELTQDTRTIVYLESLYSAEQNNSYIFGRGLHHGYDSFFQYKREGNTDKNDTSERLAEAQILNYFTSGGIVMCAIVFLLFAATFITTWNSENDYIKLCGLFVTLIWLYHWIELPINCDATTLCIWIAVGMCLSPEFRDMTNEEMEDYLHEIL